MGTSWMLRSWRYPRVPGQRICDTVFSDLISSWDGNSRLQPGTGMCLRCFRNVGKSTSWYRWTLVLLYTRDSVYAFYACSAGQTETVDDLPLSVQQLAVADALHPLAISIDTSNCPIGSNVWGPSLRIPSWCSALPLTLWCCWHQWCMDPMSASRGSIRRAHRDEWVYQRTAAGVDGVRFLAVRLLANVLTEWGNCYVTVRCLAAWLHAQVLTEWGTFNVPVITILIKTILECVWHERLCADIEILTLYMGV